MTFPRLRRKRPLEWGVHIDMPPDLDPAKIADEIRFAFGGAARRAEPEARVAEPTIGTIVHYVFPRDEYPKVCRAAIVTEVYGNVSLCVLERHGMSFLVDVTEDEMPGEWCGGMWHWPCDVSEPAPTG